MVDFKLGKKYRINGEVFRITGSSLGNKMASGWAGPGFVHAKNVKTGEKRTFQGSLNTTWDESKHPRRPAGSEAGGEFGPSTMATTSKMKVSSPKPILKKG
jgi:hypothetical protein